jgi:exopolyphosphatase/guanosine-5'-triphosphate,3'-diphosphate pyrophosphatase
LRLAAYHNYESAHAHRVAAYAQHVFDELAQIHRLGERERFLLRCAAILHDVAKHEPSHHKAAMRIVLNTPHLPFDLTTRRVVGLTARYHRKALPSVAHRHFAALNPAHRNVVRNLAGILRVADALDSGHRGAVKALRFEVDPSRIIGRCSLRHRAAAEFREMIHARTLQKSLLLENVTGRRLTLEWE